MNKPYLTGKLKSIDDHIRASFNDLSVDNYTQGDFKFRYRRFSSFYYDGKNFHLLPQKTFYQSKSDNPYAGGIERKFLPIEDHLVKSESLSKLLLELCKSLPIDVREYEFGVHQIRVIADDEHMGKGAPEGIHQDGFDYEAHICVAKANVNGGVSLLFKDREGMHPLFEHTLKPHEYLFLDDKVVYHYVTPITPRIPNRDTYRDMFVITFEKKI